jgi:hypothetical protein
MEMAVREPRRPSSVDDASRPLGRRANKRRFVSFLQQLGGGALKSLTDEWRPWLYVRR